MVIRFFEPSVGRRRTRAGGGFLPSGEMETHRWVNPLSSPSRLDCCANGIQLTFSSMEQLLGQRESEETIGAKDCL